MKAPEPLKRSWTDHNTRIGIVRRQPFAACLIALFLCNAAAHDVGLSTADIKQTTNGSIQVLVTMAVKDMESLIEMDSNADGKVAQAEFATNSEAIERYAAEIDKAAGLVK